MREIAADIEVDFEDGELDKVASFDEKWGLVHHKVEQALVGIIAEGVEVILENWDDELLIATVRLRKEGA